MAGESVSVRVEGGGGVSEGVCAEGGGNALVRNQEPIVLAVLLLDVEDDSDTSSLPHTPYSLLTLPHTPHLTHTLSLLT